MNVVSRPASENNHHCIAGGGGNPRLDLDVTQSSLTSSRDLENWSGGTAIDQSPTASDLAPKLADHDTNQFIN